MTTPPGGATDEPQTRLRLLRAKELKLRQSVPWPVYVSCLIVIVGIRLVFGQPNAAWVNFAVAALASIGIGLLVVALRIAREKDRRLAGLRSEIDNFEKQLAGSLPANVEPSGQPDSQV